MKNIHLIVTALCLICVNTGITVCQEKSDLITAFRPEYTMNSDKIEYIDLDNDGDPDILKSILKSGLAVLWIDDDDDMQEGDIEGDTDSDCMMIDRNKDGSYGGLGDFIVDWNDEDGDGMADMQVIADNHDNPEKIWDAGHFMIVIDTDNDGIYNYIDWTSLKLEAWEHSGLANFFEDYHGNSLFMKMHASTYNVEDFRYNWENPFLFYDTDKDGLTEMAIRLVDERIYPLKNSEYKLKFARQVNDVRLAFDLDNDNLPGVEFDFDMSIGFSGEGFGYDDHFHAFKSMKGLENTDSMFLDPRLRNLDGLYYVDHEHAYDIIFNKGKWQKCKFVFDEDDDCHRWERVEFYDPLELYATGHFKGGLDNNPQADVSGDRGEWDMDCSGKGNLYVGKFDGRIHLHGAEWGAWRIDQHGKYYQGWQGWRGGHDTIPHDHCLYEPEVIPVIKYVDTDLNGFFDKILFDLNGDQSFEDSLSYFALGLKDTAHIIDISNMDYHDYALLHKKVSEDIWQSALEAIQLAHKLGINTDWYALFKTPVNTRQKYHNGYWLNYYMYRDIKKLLVRKGNKKKLLDLDKAYLLKNWDAIKP